MVKQGWRYFFCKSSVNVTALLVFMALGRVSAQTLPVESKLALGDSSIFSQWQALQSITPKFSAFPEANKSSLPDTLALDAEIDPNPNPGVRFFIEHNPFTDDSYDIRPQERTAGVGYRVSDDILVGATFDIARHWITEDRTTNDHSNDLGVALFGNYSYQQFQLDSTVEFRRSLYTDLFAQDISPPLSLQSKYDETQADQLVLGLGMGYRIASGGLSITPSLRFDYADIAMTNEFLQRDAEEVDLFSSQNFKSMTSTLAGQVSYAVDQSWGVLIPHFSFAWTHEFEQSNRLYKKEQGHALTVQPSAQHGYSITADDTEQDYFNLGLGLSARFGERSAAFLSYEKVFGKSDTADYSVSGGIRVEF